MSLGFYFDTTRCIGCKACQIACKDKNRLMKPGELFRKVLSFESGFFPLPAIYHISATCNHCTQAACVSSCPTGAMLKANDGTVIHDDEACIGCKTCIASCPYEIPVYFEERNIVQKCDACQVLRNNGGNPACVDSCPMRALHFGDIDELKKTYGADLIKDIPVWPDGATNPNTLFKVKEAVLDHEVREIIL